MNRQFFENILPGTKLFGKFELVRNLSAGENGAVYLCRNLSDDTFYALKVIATQSLKDVDSCQQLKKEIELSSKIRHPNVVSCFESFVDETFTAFSMEYIHGGTLADVIHGKELPSVEQAVATLRQIAGGLVAIHDAGIVHRDLKPENVLIGLDGSVKITDFGIAAAQSSTSAAKAEALAGTVNYLSPEYIAHGVFDERSDIYAFGVVAYELLTGQAPFAGASLIDTLVRRVQFDPRAPRELRPEISRTLSELILKAMQRTPERRHQHAREILGAIELIEMVEHAVLPQSALRPLDLPQSLLQRPAARLAA